MDLTIEDMPRGTVVVIRPEHGGGVAVVTEHKLSRPKYPLVAKMLNGQTLKSRGLYKLGVNQILATIGTVDVDKLMGLKAPAAALRPQRSSQDDTWAMPERLKEMGIKPGDTIEIRHGHGTRRVAIYTGYSANRPKYPVGYELNGKQWKGAASAIIRKVPDAATQ